MRIYLPCLTIDVVNRYKSHFPKFPLGGLQSYGRPEKDTKGLWDSGIPIILDSGTFTLNHSEKRNGMRITKEGYANYLVNNKSNFDFYFNFDSNFESEGFSENLENLMYLERKNLKPIPVIHDIDMNGVEIKYYIDKKYPIVALGSRQIKKADQVSELTKSLYRHGMKVHLLGSVKYDYLKDARILSCDGSSWMRTANIGDVYFWNKNMAGADKKVVINFGEANSVSMQNHYTIHKDRGHFMKFLNDKFGFKSCDLLGNDRYVNRQIVNIYYYSQLQAAINKIHKKGGYLIK
jgi:hypothetical protein